MANPTIPHLFYAHGFVILSNGLKAVMGGAHAPFDVFAPWKRLDEAALDERRREFLRLTAEVERRARVILLVDGHKDGRREALMGAGGGLGPAQPELKARLRPCCSVRARPTRSTGAVDRTSLRWSMTSKMSAVPARARSRLISATIPLWRRAGCGGVGLRRNTGKPGVEAKTDTAYLAVFLKAKAC